MGNCTDCKEYNKEKHYCPKFCDVIRNTDKEMREQYKGEHEKLEKIKQIINEYNNGNDMEYEYLDKIREVLEDE